MEENFKKYLCEFCEKNCINSTIVKNTEKEITTYKCNNYKRKDKH